MMQSRNQREGRYVGYINLWMLDGRKKYVRFKKSRLSVKSNHALYVEISRYRTFVMRDIQ